MLRTEEKAAAITGAQDAFRSALMKNLKLENLRRVITAPRSSFSSLELGNLADYLNLNQITDVVSVAKTLGAGCAILYNAVVRNAFDKGNKIVTDLLDEDNLRVNVVFNEEPSVADPLALISGWVSFRFQFASTGFPKSLSGYQKTAEAAHKAQNI